MLLAMLAIASGCDYSLDSVEGHELGLPTSSLFGYNTARELMVVLSDMPDLCPLMSDTESPPYGDYWVLSVWTLSAYETDDPMSADGYVGILDSGEDLEVDGRGTIELKELEESYAKGIVEMTFGNDEVRARFEAEPCDAPFFQGLE